MTRLLVVGAGVVGLCTALYARRRGLDVTLVDRDGPDHLGASFGNAGMVTPSHFVPLASPGAVMLGFKWMWNPNAPLFVRPRLSLAFARWLFLFWRSANRAHVERASPLIRDLNLASRDCYEELAREPGADFGLDRRGLLMVCTTQHGLDEEAYAGAMAQRLGLAARVLSRDEARAREPQLRHDIAGAVLHEDDAHLSPDRFVRWLRATLLREGVQFLWNREVVGWRVEGGRVLAATTSGAEDLQADEYVACGGSWSPGLLHGTGLRLPVEAGAGYTFTVDEPQVQLRQPAILVERRVAVTPMGERLRVGGTMELSGMDLGIRHGRSQAILRSMASYYEPGVVSQFGQVKAWKGLRPCTPDGVPFIGRVPDLRNLIVATGHAMMGLSLAPITGKLVGQVMAGEKTDVAMELMRVDRFG